MKIYYNLIKFIEKTLENNFIYLLPFCIFFIKIIKNNINM